MFGAACGLVGVALGVLVVHIYEILRQLDRATTTQSAAPSPTSLRKASPMPSATAAWRVGLAAVVYLGAHWSAGTRRD